MDRAEVRHRVAKALAQGAIAALVATFCYGTAGAMSFLRETYWAPIAALTVLYPDQKSTRKAALERFLGTLIGSAVGWAGAVLWHGHIVLYALAVLVAVGVCELMAFDAASRLCAVAVTVITIVPHSEPAHEVAFFRFVEVSYGVGCALGARTLIEWIRRRRLPRNAAPPPVC